MHKVINVCLIMFFVGCVALAEDTTQKVNVVFGVNNFEQMFSKGELTSQVRSIYIGYDQKKTGENNTYATAFGGMLKYELASFNGFNVAIAVTGSQDIGFATGDANQYKQNTELSSSKGSYLEVSEAYINYKNNGFNIRLGRQMVETPLADTDDTRMIPNTFEAYMLTYESNKLLFTLGNLQKWQGAGVNLNDNWIDVEASGISMIGLSYDHFLKFNVWYYDIQKLNYESGASYFELGYKFEEKLSLQALVQYLHQSEKKNSEIQADIYGAILKLTVDNIDTYVAYNKAKKHIGKRSFSGIGGGSLYTNMDTMLLDELADDRDASALVFGIEYNLNNLKLQYVYGDFKGKQNSVGNTMYIVEQNFGFEYTLDNAFNLVAIYVKEEDKQSSIKTINDWDRVQLMITYDF